VVSIHSIHNSLRRRLGDVTWFGCSATLDQRTLDIARKMAGFQASCEFFRSSVDRPEIKLIVEILQPRTTKRFTSLFFVLLAAMTDGLPTLVRIPKTDLYLLQVLSTTSRFLYLFCLCFRLCAPICGLLRAPLISPTTKILTKKLIVRPSLLELKGGIN
jgi:hypothetical protein